MKNESTFFVSNLRNNTLGLLSLFVFILFSSSFHVYGQELVLNGVDYQIDTIRMFKAGPGCDYWATRMTRVKDGKGRLDAYFLRVDTKSPYIHLQHIKAKDMLIATERPSSMMTRTTTPTHVVIGGTNGDFYATSGDVGTPTGPSIIDGEFLYLGKSERSLGAVNTDGLAVFGSTYCWDFSAKLQMPDTTISINNVNKTRGENQLILYNSYLKSTRTNQYGTEVLVKLQEGEKWTTKGVVKLIVVDVLKGQGDATIQAGQCVLSAHGTKATELNKLKIGDEVSIKFSFKVNDVAQDLAQCIGADWYTQIVTNGEVAQKDFWNELHPRTGFGANAAGDTLLFCVVDGRGVSIGCTTKVLGEIMKHNGAWNAVNWDGGGSSCMVINNLGSMNRNSDANERAVCDGMFVVADVPQADTTIVEIAPYEHTIVLPRYGVYNPQFYGYNQYEIMLSADLQNVKLSCDASLGEIMEDGTFFASGTEGGVLRATYGDVHTDIKVELAIDSPVTFRLDSILLDNRRNYEVEITSTVDEKVVTIPAYPLDWESLDETVCVVDELGVIKAVSNGVTSVIGTVGSLADTLQVRVELPSAPVQIFTTLKDETEDWLLSANSGYNPILKEPDETNPYVDLQFTYAGGRAPFVMMENNVPLYGLPDSIRIVVNTDAVLKSIDLGLRQNDKLEGDYALMTVENIDNTGDVVTTIAMSDLMNTTDIAIYPIWFNVLSFNLSSETSKTLHHIYIKELTLCYAGVEVNYLDNANIPDWYVYPNPIVDGCLQVNNTTVGDCLVLRDLQGRVLLQEIVGADNMQINMQSYPAGQYLLTINEETVKIIKQ